MTNPTSTEPYSDQRGTSSSNDMEMVDVETKSQDLEGMEEYHDKESFHDELDNAVSTTTPTSAYGKRFARWVVPAAILCAFLLVGVSLRVTSNPKGNQAQAAGSSSNSASSSTKPPKTDTPASSTKGCVFKDRFDNQHNFQHNKLFPGQYICSHNMTDNGKQDQRYRFGLNMKGNLVLTDNKVPEWAVGGNHKYNKVFYRNVNGTIGDGYHFALQIDGTWVILDDTDGEQKWSLTPNKDMHLDEKCLDKHDCPYLHIHADGVLVVNYIDDDKQWQAKNSLHVYGF